MLVVAGDTESAQRPEYEHDACEDRSAWYRAEDAAVLRGASVVSQDEVLVVAEVDGREWKRPNRVGLLAIDEHVAMLG